ncbi:MAG: alpha-1,4-glucan--maltose-1-phosphate maltosyltransferase [Candidatus Dormibacterales bacterium]
MPKASTRRTEVGARGGEAGPSRVAIESVRPEIDCGRFAAKAVAGDRFRVEADVFADGHDLVRCAVLHRRPRGRRWVEVPMRPLGNDRWAGEFRVDTLGRHAYTVEGWVDPFATWAADFAKRVEAGAETEADLEIGAALVDAAAGRALGRDRDRLHLFARLLRSGGPQARRAALSRALAGAAARHPDRSGALRHPRELEVVVEPQLCRFSAWYEMFPRSASPVPGRHGTFADVEERLAYVREMGFDVLYLPPIHPIGTSFRKGRNNSVSAAKADPGSPWAIGSQVGGHREIHPDLGTPEDFRRLLGRARSMGLEIAIDLAFQASPDHPYVTRHPEWFRKRPDGGIQYAENPPKKYEDIVPFDFETHDREGLWRELRGVVEHWLEQGVRVFRVDNPHTKPFAFWEWLIASVKERHPEVLFLSEAFTRPRLMARLAKAGFSQSYTYFAWRTSRAELQRYMEELTRSEVAHYLRPSLWPNTPDILTQELQQGGRAAFLSRLVLAATLAASYGIYGPAFELVENRALVPGREEYLDSEKYQLRHWDLDDEGSLRHLIARLNAIRRANPALQEDTSLTFHGAGNDRLIAYSKRSRDGSNIVLVIVNLDHQYTQSGWTDLWLEGMGIDADRPFGVHDLLQDAHHRWQGRHNYVELNPHVMPAHVFRLEP